MEYTKINREIGRSVRYKDSMNIIEKLNNVNLLGNSIPNKLDLSSYIDLTEDKRFSYLMNLYEYLNPYWLNLYNRLEEEKPANISTPLPKDYTMSKIIKGATGDTVIEKTLAMYASNKIAHICENARNNVLEYYFYTKNINLKHKYFKKVSNSIFMLFDPSVAKTPQLVKNLYRTLGNYGINSVNINELEKLGLNTLSETQRSAFAIKDFEMDNVIQELKQTEISYGKYSTQAKNSNGDYLLNNDNSPKMEHLLVIDLPYYGQFSVHMKTEESISSLSKTPYDSLRIHEKRSTLITDELSKQAKKDFGKSKSLSIQELKEFMKTDPRYAHYLAVKSGCGKAEIDELYQCFNQKQKYNKSR